MQVSTISPAPSCSTSRAQATASRPVPHAAAVDVDFPEPRGRLAATRLGSMFTTMHWLPNRRAASRTNSGFAAAAELIETLSQPALSKLRGCRRSVRMPPPTVSGMNTTSAVRRTTSSMIVAALVAGRDVEEHQLVGPFLLVAGGHLDRVAGVAQVQEVGPLDHAAAVDIEAGNDALGEHGDGVVVDSSLTLRVGAQATSTRDFIVRGDRGTVN